MSGHTPGPWGIEGAVDVRIKAGPIHVATIPRASDGDWSPANARLIAAAPDTKQACQTTANQIQTLIDDWQGLDPIKIQERLIDIQRVAIAAIAKAEGRS